jgi:hypothetical protein
MTLATKAAMVLVSVFIWALPAVSAADIATVSSHRYLASSDFERELTLDVDGESLRFLLNPSAVTGDLALLDQDGRELVYNDESFAGELDGEKGSWARLTINSQRLSGVYSRQGRQYEITTEQSGLIQVGPLAEQQNPLFQQQRKVLAVVQPPVTRIADIAIVVDSQYNTHFNGNGVQRALTIINAVDGIYRQEFGLALRVTKVITVNDPANDPFNYGAVPIERMLRNFRQYRLNSDNLLDVSLVHLFTGNQNTDEPVGLAWINTACRTDGYDVGISTPYRYDVLLTAHEIAHNLGAQHDTDTACASEVDKVMWPYISLNTSQNFSSCTLESVQQSLANSCHAQTVDLQVSLNQTGASTMEVTVRNNDNSLVNPAATLKVDLPESSIAAALDSRCQVPGNSIECNFGTLQAGQEERVAFTLVSTPQSDRTAEIFVENPDFADPLPANNHAQVLINNGVILSFLEPRGPLPSYDRDAAAGTATIDALGHFSRFDLLLLLAGTIVLRCFRRRQRVTR